MEPHPLRPPPEARAALAHFVEWYLEWKRKKEQAMAPQPPPAPLPLEETDSLVTF